MVRKQECNEFTNSPFTQTIVAGAVRVHQIITNIPQTRNIHTRRRHEEILGLINVRIRTILLRLGGVEIDGAVDAVHHVATIVTVEGILSPAAIGIARMVGPANLGAVGDLGVGTGSPVLPVARHGRLGRVHLILDVVGTVEGRIGGPVGNIMDDEVVGGNTKGVLVQESCYLIPLADATGILSQDEARIGTGSWKINGALGRGVRAGERSWRSKDGSSLSSSGRLPLPTIVGPSDGDDLDVFSGRGICLNLGESTESISGGQGHFESTPLGQVDVGGRIGGNGTAVHGEDRRRRRMGQRRTRRRRISWSLGRTGRWARRGNLGDLDLAPCPGITSQASAGVSFDPVDAFSSVLAQVDRNKGPINQFIAIIDVSLAVSSFETRTGTVAHVAVYTINALTIFTWFRRTLIDISTSGTTGGNIDAVATVPYRAPARKATDGLV